jgi:hypothetical protein
MNLIFEKACELAAALGWENISLSPGCTEHQIDEHWWFAINPHHEPTLCSRSRNRVPPNCIYFECDGSPEGIVSLDGGLLVADVDTLLGVLEQAIEKLPRIQEAIETNPARLLQ